MELVHKAEKALEGIFTSLPSLPKDAKKGLADLLPWLVGIGGLLQLWSAWQLYRWADSWGRVADWANTWARSMGVETGSSGYSLWLWISVVAAALTGVIMLIAFSKVQQKLKSGWDLVFLAAIINLIYGVLTVFIDSYGSNSLIGALIGSAIGFYLLFQVREYFGGKAAASTTADTKKSDTSEE